MLEIYMPPPHTGFILIPLRMINKLVPSQSV